MRAPLGQAAEIVRGVTFEKSEAATSPNRDRAPVLRAGNIRDKLILDSDLLWIPPERISRDQWLRPSDIVVCMSSGSASVVGKSAQLLAPWRGTFGAFCAVVRSRAEADAGYLAHWLRSPEFAAWRDSRVRGANIQNLRASELAAVELPLPALPEQRRIAARLTEQLAAVERARRAAEERVEAARGLARSTLAAAFSDSVRADWPVSPLGDEAAIAGGVTIGRRLNGTQVREVPYVRVANVKDGRLDLSEVKSTPATREEIDELRLRRGDLLLTEGGDPDKLGRGTVWLDELPLCIHQNHIFRVRFDQARFVPEFVSMQIGSPYGKAYFLRHAKQTTGIATINRRVLGAFPLLSPPFAEQQRLVEAVTQRLRMAGSVAATAESELTAIEALPAALLREAFEGEA
jgi:type I restriction enzyme S subunit